MVIPAIDREESLPIDRTTFPRARHKNTTRERRFVGVATRVVEKCPVYYSTFVPLSSRFTVPSCVCLILFGVRLFNEPVRVRFACKWRRPVYKREGRKRSENVEGRWGEEGGGGTCERGICFVTPPGVLFDNYAGLEIAPAPRVSFLFPYLFFHSKTRMSRYSFL